MLVVFLKTKCSEMRETQRSDIELHQNVNKLTRKEEILTDNRNVSNASLGHRV